MFLRVNLLCVFLWLLKINLPRVHISLIPHRPELWWVETPNHPQVSSLHYSRMARFLAKLDKKGQRTPAWGISLHARSSVSMRFWCCQVHYYLTISMIDLHHTKKHFGCSYGSRIKLLEKRNLINEYANLPPYMSCFDNANVATIQTNNTADILWNVVQIKQAQFFGNLEKT